MRVRERREREGRSSILIVNHHYQHPHVDKHIEILNIIFITYIYINHIQFIITFSANKPTNFKCHPIILQTNETLNKLEREGVSLRC